MKPPLARPYSLTGYPMIREFSISNFKCFKELSVGACKPLNIIVGDNGVGKTALLEALFLALGQTSELAGRFRTQRGYGATLAGSQKRIEEALFRRLFHNGDWKTPIAIQLSGEGAESRSVFVSRGTETLTLQFDAGVHSPADSAPQYISTPLTFAWKDTNGVIRHAMPRVGPRGVEFPGTDEELPDFLYFASGNQNLAEETASRFSELSRSGLLSHFTNLFRASYEWIEDMRIEVEGGIPLVFVKIKNQREPLPLAAVSGGVNRMAGIMLGIAAAAGSVVLIDEIENGIFYDHHQSVIRSIVSLAEGYKTQLFMTSHSMEWIQSFFQVAGDKVENIAVWRLERASDGTPVLYNFEGGRAKIAVERGADMRGDS